jgi:hypothetical protein
VEPCRARGAGSPTAGVRLLHIDGGGNAEGCRRWPRLRILARLPPRSSARCSVHRVVWSSVPLDEMGRLGHLRNPSRRHPSPLSVVPVVVDGHPLIPSSPDPAIRSPDLHDMTCPVRRWRLPLSRPPWRACGDGATPACHRLTWLPEMALS